MKLEHIQADNFLRLNLLDVPLGDSTFHLFAGNNEAGKSSVQEAIRFALRGETLRVSLKRDYKLMIRDGAKDGSVALKVDGVNIIRDIGSGDLTSHEDGIALPDFLPYLLNSQRFAHQKPADRRNFLLELTKTSVEPDDIAKRMAAKGVHESCIDGVKPMLRSSLDAAHKHATGERSKMKTMWEGVSGRKYGSKIAEDWKPAPPDDYDPQALLDGEQEATQIKERIDKLNIEKGRYTAQIDDAEKTLAQIEEGGAFDSDELDRLEGKLEEAFIRLEPLNKQREDINHRLSNAKEKVPVTCCECGAKLRVSFTGKTANVEPYVPMEDDAIAQEQADLMNTSREIGKLENVVDNIKHQIAKQERLRAIAAADTGKVLPSQDGLQALRDVLQGINDQIEGERANQQVIDDKLVKLRTAATQVRDAKEIEERARKLHRGAVAWDKCVSVLAPDGIPAEILSDALKPVNDRLRNTANLTGWPQVTIDPAMEVVVDGRRYSLLSESARWRADVAIADAIAHLSGLGLLIVDRMDVLDIPSRGKFMEWMSKVMDEYETILVFATMKAAPKLPQGMESHWIENGEIKEVA